MHLTFAPLHSVCVFTCLPKEDLESLLLVVASPSNPPNSALKRPRPPRPPRAPRGWRTSTTSDRVRTETADHLFGHGLRIGETSHLHHPTTWTDPPTIDSEARREASCGVRHDGRMVLEGNRSSRGVRRSAWVVLGVSVDQICSATLAEPTIWQIWASGMDDSMRKIRCHSCVFVLGLGCWAPAEMFSSS